MLCYAAVGLERVQPLEGWMVMGRTGKQEPSPGYRAGQARDHSQLRAVMKELELLEGPDSSGFSYCHAS